MYLSSVDSVVADIKIFNHQHFILEDHLCHTFLSVYATFIQMLHTNCQANQHHDILVILVVIYNH